MLFALTLAHATSTGATPSPAPDGFDCGQCHNQTGNFLDLAPPESRPDLRVEVLDGPAGTVESPLAVNEPVHLRLTVASAFDEAGRSLGLGLAVVPLESNGIERAGTLASPDDTLQPTVLDNGDLTQRSPIPWDSGVVSLDLELTPSRAGDLVLYVVANDVDGDGEAGAGDFVWPQRFCFTADRTEGLASDLCDAVFEPASVDSSVPDDAEPEKGCTTVPRGTPLLGFLALLGFRRNTRYGQTGGG